MDERPLWAIDEVFVIACATSYHAAVMAKYAIERWTRMPTEIGIASEFRYRDSVFDSRSLEMKARDGTIVLVVEEGDG